MHSTPSPSNINLEMIEAKHRLMVILMKDVYAIFDPIWKTGSRTCTTTASGPSGTQSCQSSSSRPTAQKAGKRRMQGRESPPPDESNSKRGRNSVSGSRLPSLNRMYACPFHKYDSRKYTLNHETGARYRCCPGPGFSNISQVKWVTPKLTMLAY